jgi:hypothetical protein
LDGGSAHCKAATYTQTSMPRVGFETTTPVFKQAKTIHALDRTATDCELRYVYVWVLKRNLFQLVIECIMLCKSPSLYSQYSEKDYTILMYYVYLCISHLSLIIHAFLIPIHYTLWLAKVNGGIYSRFFAEISYFYEMLWYPKKNF